MRYSGIQPQYFPRLHYFARAFSTDIFMIRDEAQFVRKHKFPDGKNGKSFQADTIIKFPSKEHFLSVPIKHGGNHFLPISEVEISYDLNWVKNHLDTIKFVYAKGRQFKALFPQLEFLLQRDYRFLSELNIATFLWGILVVLDQEVNEKTLTIKYVNQLLQIQKLIRLKKIKLSSQSDNLTKIKKMSANQKIVALIKEVNADEDYCGGTSIAAYVDHSLFEKNGIKITVQDWKCKKYSQLFIKQGFISNLSIIDLLLNVSPNQARDILLG